MTAWVQQLFFVVLALSATGGASGATTAAADPGGPWRAPEVVQIPVPDFAGADAIWGATGRDRRGHVWFAVCTRNAEYPSARLFEFVPGSGEVIARGDVLAALKQCRLYRPGLNQRKIHSKIVQAADGYLYFASMDEQGEDQNSGKPPIWGSHLWRLRPPENRWEHLMAAPEGLIAVACGGGRVYALGYFGHRLYQYDCATGRVRSVLVGAIGGHVSRNLLSDGRGHAYVPRVKVGRRGPVATLVEFDESLRQVGEVPLKRYFRGRPAGSHGIIGFQTLPDGSIAFLTHNGHLSLLRPSAEGPAGLTDLGWFHPRGSSYSASLFLDSTGRFLMGVARKDDPYEWVVYDLKARASKAFAFALDASGGPANPSPRRRGPLSRAMLYGSETRDDAGNCYVVGARRRSGGGFRPILLQVRPGR